MKYAPINWQDGMKINRDHFVGLEYALRNEMQDQAAVTPHQYGLRPALGQVPSQFDLWLKLERDGQMLLTLSACRLIGLNGGTFELTPSQPSLSLQASLVDIQAANASQKQIFVVIHVNPYQRRGTGEVDPEENPPRLPFTHANQQLKLSPVFLDGANSGGAFDVTVGKILLQDKAASLDPGFIPPLTTWMAHPVTQQHYQSWLNSLIAIEGYAHQTLDRLRQLSKQGSGDLFANTLELGPVAQRLTTRILELGSRLIPDLNGALRYQSPVIAFSAVQAHARSLRNFAAEIGGNASKEWLNFLAQSMQMKSYQSAIEALVKASYSHQDMGSAVQLINQYLGMLTQLYHPQSGLPVSNFNWQRMVDIGISIEEQDGPATDVL